MPPARLFEITLLSGPDFGQSWSGVGRPHIFSGSHLSRRSRKDYSVWINLDVAVIFAVIFLIAENSLLRHPWRTQSANLVTFCGSQKTLGSPPLLRSCSRHVMQFITVRRIFIDVAGCLEEPRINSKIEALDMTVIDWSIDYDWLINVAWIYRFVRNKHVGPPYRLAQNVC